MRHVLYIHGLDSSPHPDKLALLEPFCDTLKAPQLDYRGNAQVFPELLALCRAEPINCIVGSSAGGLMAYWLLRAIKGKGLLYNPALSMLEHRPDIPAKRLALTRPDHAPYHLILGKKDEVVPYQGTLGYLESQARPGSYTFELLEGLGHTIPLDVFQETSARFFREKYE